MDRVLCSTLTGTGVGALVFFGLQNAEDTNSDFPPEPLQPLTPPTPPNPPPPERSPRPKPPLDLPRLNPLFVLGLKSAMLDWRKEGY